MLRCGNNTLPYAVDREIEDLAALIAEAGGSAAVFGYSSGAFLALQAAGQGLPIAHTLVYDATILGHAWRPTELAASVMTHSSTAF